MSIMDNCRWGTPPTDEEIDAFFARCVVVTGYDDLAREIADQTGRYWQDCLDEAYDMQAELRAFAGVWDLCAVSQGHGIDG